MYLYGIPNVLAQDLHYAIKLFVECGNEGISQAYFNIAYIYFVGMKTQPLDEDTKVQHIQQNLALAVQLFEKAANMGDSGAMFWVAYCYHMYVKHNENALLWLHKAIEHQHPTAIYYLAMMHRTGDGVEKDFKVSRRRQLQPHLC